MNSSLIAIAILAAGISLAHATDRCTDSQMKQAFSSAPARNGSVLVAKTFLEDPITMTYAVVVYDAQQEGYPLVCERRHTLPGVAHSALTAQRQPKH
jgi:hypothetical protein